MMFLFKNSCLVIGHIDNADVKIKVKDPFPQQGQGQKLSLFL
jgi:hypothetical protein